MVIPGTAAKMILERLYAEIMDENGEVALARFADHDAIDIRIKTLKDILGNIPVRFDKLIACIENDRDLDNLDPKVRVKALADYCRTALGLMEAEIVKSERRIG